MKTPVDNIEIRNLSVIFEGDPPFSALENISLSIAPGKTLALVGQSGSGKSITALALMGLLPANAKVSGEIILPGFPQLHPQNKKSFQQIRGKHIGMIFQEPMSALNPIRSCGNQLKESILAHQKLSGTEAKKRVIQWFEKVKLPNPQEIYDRYPHQLSGGQKQRVMIAMAMCNHPQLLIADEPTTALDVTIQSEIVLLMKQLQEEMNIAILFITHDLALARLMTDDFLILEKGKVIQSALDFSLPLPKAEEPMRKSISLPLLDVVELTVIYPQNSNFLGKVRQVYKAVNEVNFSLYPGETLGLVGESGCGKSTISKAIMGLQPISSGRIEFKGEDISKYTAKEWRKIRKKIQIIFQDPYASLNPRIKIGEVLKEPMKCHHIAEGKNLELKMEELLDLVQLTKDAQHKYPHEFSGGQRQRICIARALAVEPELIICDESVSALDIKIQGQILSLLSKLQIEKDLTYLFISHDLNVVRSMSDRILIMEKGRIVEQGPTEKVMGFPEEAYTKKLLASVPGRNKL